MVDQARAALAANRPTERKRLARGWELRGLLRCSCGWKMSTHTAKSSGNGAEYHYYLCKQRKQRRQTCDCTQRAVRAEEVERLVWEFVSNLLRDPEEIRRGMQHLIERERTDRTGDPEHEAEVWAGKIAECDRRRSAYQDQQAAGMMTLNELGDRLAQLDEARQAILREIDAHQNRGERLRRLVGLRDRLGERADIWEGYKEEFPDYEKRAASWWEVPPEVREGFIGPMPWHWDAYALSRKEELDNATPEERHAHYRELELRVVARSKEELEISGVFGEELIYIWNPSPRRRRTEITSSASTPTG